MFALELSRIPGFGTTSATTSFLIRDFPAKVRTPQRECLGGPYGEKIAVGVWLMVRETKDTLQSKAGLDPVPARVGPIPV